MLKLIAAIILSLSFIFLLKEGFISLRPGNLPSPPAADVKKQAKPQGAYQADKSVSFYPAVPPALPDLNKGYLFNEERTLEGAVDAAGTEEGDEAAESLVVDMETVFYAGSIIIGDVRKGLVTFPAAATPVRKTARPQKGGAAPAPPSVPKQRNYAQLVAGESFSGYKVLAVEADRIIFQKGEETVEKLLNDPKKSRIAAPAPQPPAQQKQKAAPPAATTKTNRVQLDKAKTATRPVQSTRPGASSPRTVPGSRVQVPGVPAPATASAPAPIPVPAPAPAPVPEELEPPQDETTN